MQRFGAAEGGRLGRSRERRLPRAFLVALGLALGPLQGVGSADGPKPLPGNKPCPYPARAQAQHVAGPVWFTVELRSDGTVASVEIRKVPDRGLGFEEAVRACVGGWLFDPAQGGEAPLRSSGGEVRFRLNTAEESAIRGLLESLAAAWNSRDMRALGELALRPKDSPNFNRVDHPLQEQLKGGPGGESWQMALTRETESIRFLGPDLAYARQRCQPRSASAGATGGDAVDVAALDVLVAKGARGWRLVSVWPLGAIWVDSPRAGTDVPMPRRIKETKVEYPALGAQARIQGTVALECVVSAEGKVREVRIVRGVHPVLDAAALEGVRQWEFAPTIVGDLAVPVVVPATVNFLPPTPEQKPSAPPPRATRPHEVL